MNGANAAGTQIWHERYMPFGEKLQSAAANEDDMGFTGHINDATGLTYMQARFYDPVTARFLSVDPVGFLESGKPAMYNRFSYAFNDPTNLTDPTGMCPQCVIGAAKQAAKNLVKKPLKKRLVKALGGAEKAEFAAELLTSSTPTEAAAVVAQELVGKAADALKAARRVHGNSKLSSKPQHRYEISDQTGDVKKTGISGGELNQNGTSRRANTQVNQLNRTGDGNTYSADVVETDIPGRGVALDIEKAATKKLKDEGNSLRLQQRPK